MKKYWEAVDAGAYVRITCRLKFNDGREGGVSRMMWRLGEPNPKYLTAIVECMNRDIAALAERNGAQ